MNCRKCNTNLYNNFEVCPVCETPSSIKIGVKPIESLNEWLDKDSKLSNIEKFYIVVKDSLIYKNRFYNNLPRDIKIKPILKFLIILFSLFMLFKYISNPTLIETTSENNNYLLLVIKTILKSVFATILLIPLWSIYIYILHGYLSIIDKNNISYKKLFSALSFTLTPLLFLYLPSFISTFIIVVISTYQINAISIIYNRGKTFILLYIMLPFIVIAMIIMLFLLVVFSSLFSSLFQSGLLNNIKELFI